MEFEEKMGYYRKEIEAELKVFLTKEKKEDDFYDTIEEYMNVGGKRIRPIAVVAAYEALRGENKKILLPSLSVEFFHNSTLCHDDIMDEDTFRRNKPSCHKAFQNLFLKNFKENSYQGDIFSEFSTRFGVSNAIIAGNILNFLGYKCIFEADFPLEIKQLACKKITQTIIEVNHGQILDLILEQKKDATEKEYLEMSGKKTAYLLGSCFEIGGIFAEANEEIRKNLFEYGFNLGLAFQIMDDVIDINESKGREIGSDIKKGKITIIFVHALNKSNDSERALLKGTLEGSNEDIKKIITIFKERGSINYAKKLAEIRINEAKKSLNKIHSSFLDNLAEYIIKRKT